MKRYFYERDALRRCGAALAIHVNMYGHAHSAKAAEAWAQLLFTDPKPPHYLARLRRAEAAYRAVRAWEATCLRPWA